jgi:hypothetical protein
MAESNITEDPAGDGPPPLASAPLDDLQALVGEWSMKARFPGSPPSEPQGRTVFEWLPGRRFLVQRWEVPHPAAPDGLAIIGPDSEREAYFQHYYDSRGVARVYAMTLDDGLWTLLRDTPDLSPLDFSQRFTAQLDPSGEEIRGSWEISSDGAIWRHDFELIYARLR